jgi:hypothetical protein
VSVFLLLEAGKHCDDTLVLCDPKSLSDLLAVLWVEPRRIDPVAHDAVLGAIVAQKASDELGARV